MRFPGWRHMNNLSCAAAYCLNIWRTIHALDKLYYISHRLSVVTNILASIILHSIHLNRINTYACKSLHFFFHYCFPSIWFPMVLNRVNDSRIRAPRRDSPSIHTYRKKKKYFFSMRLKRRTTHNPFSCS